MRALFEKIQKYWKEEKDSGKSFEMFIEELEKNNPESLEGILSFCILGIRLLSFTKKDQSVTKMSRIISSSIADIVRCINDGGLSPEERMNIMTTIIAILIRRHGPILIKSDEITRDNISINTYSDAITADLAREYAGGVC